MRTAQKQTVAFLNIWYICDKYLACVYDCGIVYVVDVFNEVKKNLCYVTN